MPQATEELRDEMRRLFNDSIDISGPIKYLENAGYILQRNWLWKPKPDVTSYEQMTQDEYLCMAFLVQEWDFGGLLKDEHTVSI